ncbi:uncharacterized protein si:dkey-1k23.3 [Cebidichthys violaceus]|uniref:uncharacterized protein si:dkey-1k23.3 n=1 Tax=Cebidichthys violaceus TaxID=271503 RepID=UPI0035CADCD3
MSEHDKTESSCGAYGGGVPWFPLRKWWQSSRLFNQDVGMPPFLEPGDPRWMDVDRLQRSLAGCFWPGYIPAPLFVPYISGPTNHAGQQMNKEQYKWRVGLEVAHFLPSEISLSVRDGFLEVGGRHEERPDEHGFIARCFTRKYRLPAEIDVTKIVSTLSVDGILTVEAPLSKSSVPSPIIIPIKVELEVTGEKQERHEDPETELDNCRAMEAQCFPSADDDGKESQPEVQGDQAHPDSAAAGPQQHDEGKEQEEETHEEPAGESRPSAPVDGEDIVSLQDSQKRREDQETPTDASERAEQKQPAVDGEIQVVAGSEEEAAEEISHPEEPEPGESPPSQEDLSQEPEAADVKQEHAE